MSFCPSADTINFIFRNALLNCTDNGDLHISGGSLLPYVVYVVQQQHADIALLKSENKILSEQLLLHTTEITALQSTVAQQSTQVLQAQVNAQQIQIAQLLARLNAASIT